MAPRQVGRPVFTERERKVVPVAVLIHCTQVIREKALRGIKLSECLLRAWMIGLVYIIVRDIFSIRRQIAAFRFNNGIAAHYRKMMDMVLEGVGKVILRIPVVCIFFNQTQGVVCIQTDYVNLSQCQQSVIIIRLIVSFPCVVIIVVVRIHDGIRQHRIEFEMRGKVVIEVDVRPKHVVYQTVMVFFLLCI